MRTQKPTNPRKKPVQERSKATVAALLTATAQVLVEEGYHRASTNRIAKRAGVSVGSLYQYFPNKDALINSLLERLVDKQFSLLENKLLEVQEMDLPTAIREILDALVRVRQVEPELTKVLFEQVPRTGEMDMVNRWNARAAQTIHAALENRKEDVRPKNLEIAAYILVQSFHGTIHHTVVHNTPLLSDERLQEEFRDMILRYLCPDPPTP